MQLEVVDSTSPSSASSYKVYQQRALEISFDTLTTEVECGRGRSSDDDDRPIFFALKNHFRQTQTFIYTEM